MTIGYAALLIVCISSASNAGVKHKGATGKSHPADRAGGVVENARVIQRQGHGGPGGFANEVGDELRAFTQSPWRRHHARRVVKAPGQASVNDGCCWKKRREV